MDGDDSVRNIFLKYAFDDDFDFWHSDSSEEIQLCRNIQPNKRTRVQNFVQTINEYSDEEFRRHFRLNRSTANLCIDDLEKANVLSTHLFGRQKVSAKTAFLMTVWYLSNQETYRQISDRFNVTESTAWRIIRKVIDYLVKTSAMVIKWPTNDDAVNIQNEFSKKQGIQGIIGAIDGSHILINRKGCNQQSYCNRKGVHSIILQAVVDCRKRFLDVCVGEPGSLHDSRVLKRSALYRKAINGTLNFYNGFLLGDSAYPTLQWLVTPYKENGHLTQEQHLFNYKHSSSRVVVENTFALLKGRFRRLRFFENKDLKFVAKSVLAACVLHNICINYGEKLDQVELYTDEDDVQHCEEENAAEVQYALENN